jgi:hypothetical protein
VRTHHTCIYICIYMGVYVYVFVSTLLYVSTHVPYVCAIDVSYREFVACARRYNLPLSDFPPVQAFKAALREVCVCIYIYMYICICVYVRIYVSIRCISICMNVPPIEEAVTSMQRT